MADPLTIQAVPNPGNTEAADEVVYSTRWFDLVSREVPGSDDRHFFVSTRDYVGVIPVTPDGRLVLVRQWRPAINAYSLEIPSGHVEDGETPAEAAAKELLEETGYVASHLTPVGKLSPCTGRLGNQMWCFFAHDVVPDSRGHSGEPGIEVVIHSGSLASLLDEPDFTSALNRGVMLQAMKSGLLSLNEPI